MSGHYSPRPLDAAWLAHCAAVNAAAELALHDEECNCRAISPDESEHQHFVAFVDCALAAGLTTINYTSGFNDPQPVALYRDGECIAQWRSV